MATLAVLFLLSWRADDVRDLLPLATLLFCFCLFSVRAYIWTVDGVLFRCVFAV